MEFTHIPAGELQRMNGRMGLVTLVAVPWIRAAVLEDGVGEIAPLSTHRLLLYALTQVKACRELVRLCPGINMLPCR